MKKIILVLFLTFACGGTEPNCFDFLASCEFQASRTSLSAFTYWFKLRDCSYDYGACIKRESEDVLCEERCDITYVPSACISACFQTTTSTN